MDIFIGRVEKLLIVTHDLFHCRGTTVYLADRRFDMLPSVLSERVCSLRHRVDRFAGKRMEGL